MLTPFSILPQKSEKAIFLLNTRNPAPRPNNDDCRQLCISQITRKVAVEIDFQGP
jgi:hypothetical protein